MGTQYSSLLSFASERVSIWLIIVDMCANLAHYIDLVSTLSRAVSETESSGEMMSNQDDLADFCHSCCGLDVTAVAEETGVPRRTLYRWWESRRSAVELMVIGITAKRYLNPLLWGETQVVQGGSRRRKR